MPQHKLSAKLAALLLAIVALGIGHIGSATAQACAPNTCCATNPTTGTPACAAVGNPLNVMSGNKFQREEDMPALPGVLGLELVRYYNSEASIADHRGILGRGWRLSYDAELVVRPGGNIITLHQGDGTQTLYAKTPFQPEPDTTIYGSNLPGGGALRLKRAASGNPLSNEYILSPAGVGNRQTFDAQGKLVLITAPTGEYVSMQRDAAGFLLRVTDPQGRFLSLGYLPRRQALADNKYRGVHHIDSPVGRFGYEYGSTPPAGSTVEPLDLLANLVKVSLPTHYDPNTPANPAGGSADRGVSSSSVSRSYHYEDARRPNLLTGISVQGQGSDAKIMSQRLATWGYDAKGRANLSVKGSWDPAKPGPEQVTLEFNVKTTDGSGTTVLTNSLGQTTRYSYVQIKGRPQLLEVRGAGCATCGPVNVQYRYDERGRQTQQLELDDKGTPIRGTSIEYDGMDRPMQVNAFSLRNGKALPSRMQVRYQYGNPENRLPLLIARPSVVAGKEHQLKLTYNAMGQPVTITESGYEPLEQKPITRTTRYTYSHINGRSVLTQIDGPLPNGPKGSPEDSDLTRYEWDERGSFLTGAVHPMGLKEVFGRDPGTGRLSEHTATDGVITRYAYTAAGQIARTERADLVITRGHDALGHVSTVFDATGRGIQLAYDAADRPVRITDAQGYASQTTFDTEGKTLVTGLYEPQQTTPLRATYRWYDENNQLAKQLSADGRFDTYAYDAQGRLIEHLDGDDVLHLVRADKLDTMQARFDLTPDGLMRMRLRRQPEPGEPGARDALRDDFGRRLILTLPDHGAKRARYDDANRLIQMAYADGSVIDYRYDPAGRLTQKTTRRAASTPAQTAAMETVTLHYEGARLAQIEDPAQTTAYAYDAAGRVAQTTFTLIGPDGKPVSTFSTATTYDPTTGQPITQKLADGKVLHVQRDAATQGAQSLDLRSPWVSWISNFIAGQLPDWMQWLQRAMPRTAVARDIRFHPFNGIAGHTEGNEISAAKSFDLAGRLTRLTVGAPQASLYDVSYGYGVGPRIRNTKTLDAQGELTPAAYRYDGFGALKGEGTAKPATLLRTSLGRPSNGVSAQRDKAGRTVDDGHYRYTYTGDGQLETVSDEAGHLKASYRYNSFAQRVSKTVYGPGQQAATNYFLWQRNKLVAEADAQGRITSQYLYLSEDGKAAPVAKIESAGNPDNASHSERILYIHTDHRGAPLAMTDSARKVVWRADLAPWGAAKVSSTDATLNLRLPGQYFDAETGLHDNFHRTYDPKAGRYLQPDPLGYPDGPDAYLYASGDPINKIDSMGLYEEDVHYYLTFFLARVADLPEETARTVALGTQYIDDNILTAPMSGAVTPNMRALPLYHFTRERNMDSTQDAATRIDNPTSAQLENLRRPTMDPSLSACARQQLFGEYIHAFEDTFAHRDQDNVPFFFTSTAGHGAYNHDPDQTYNVRDFQNNEMRTMRMAQEVFGQIQSFTGGAATHAWSEIETTVLEFVRTGQAAGNAAPRWQDMCKLNLTCDPQAAANRHAAEVDAKALMLETRLVAFGLLSVGDLRPGTGQLAYNEEEAARRRNENLKGLTHAIDPRTNQPGFVGILLPGD